MRASEMTEKLNRQVSERSERLAKQVDRKTEQLLDRLGDVLDRADSYQLDLRRRMAPPPRPASRAGFVMTLLTGIGIGLAAAYFLDQQRGAERRQMFADRSRKTFGSMGYRVQGAANDARNKAEGKLRQATSPPDNPNPDDLTLVDRVESELYRDRSIPKGKINIGAADGTVILRGQLESEDQIHSIVAAVNQIVGVRGVENLLHLAGTPAPNKVAARGNGETGPEHATH